MRPPHCVLMCLCVCVFVCVNVCVCVLVGSWGTPIFLVPLGLVNSRRVGSCANCVFDYMLMPACMGTVNAAEILLRRQIQEALEALARIGAATLLFDDHSSVSHQSYALLECRDKCVVQLLVSRTQTCLRFQTSRSARALLHTHTYIHTDCLDGKRKETRSHADTLSNRHAPHTWNKINWLFQPSFTSPPFCFALLGFQCCQFVLAAACSRPSVCVVARQFCLPL